MAEYFNYEKINPTLIMELESSFQTYLKKLYTMDEYIETYLNSNDSSALFGKKAKWLKELWENNCLVFANFYEIFKKQLQMLIAIYNNNVEYEYEIKETTWISTLNETVEGGNQPSTIHEHIDPSELTDEERDARDAELLADIYEDTHTSTVLEETAAAEVGEVVSLQMPSTKTYNNIVDSYQSAIDSANTVYTDKGYKSIYDRD